MSDITLTLGKPNSKNPDFAMENVPKFVTHCVPPCNSKTRLIAVCGVADTNQTTTKFDSNLPPGVDHPVVTRGRCDPKVEGWFISDFYGFKTLYKDTCASQVWIHSEQPQALVDVYGEYLHGNPFEDRKVVLSQDLLDEGLGKDVVVVPRAQLKQQFCLLLKREAELARNHGQSLLVMTMAYGREETHAVNLGELHNKDDWFAIDDFKNAVISESALQCGASKTDLDITYLTTACFSGGWTIQVDLNRTMFAAAGPEQESASWYGSPSIGRYSGSIYATAIMQAWDKESMAAHTVGSSPASSSTQKTLAAFHEEVYDTLFSIDKWAQVHDIRFSAQDGNWDTPWTTRAGFPLISFAHKWNQLKVVPSSNPDGMLNPSPSNKQISDQRAVQATEGFRGRFDTVNSAREFVMFQAKMYLNSFPGRDNLAKNATLHGTLHRLRSRKFYANMEQLESISLQVRYRLALSHRATWLVKAAGLPLPDGKSCDHWEEASFQMWMREDPTEDVSRRYTMAVRKIFATVVPEPTREQGLPWNKPNHYIATALAMNSRIREPAHLNDAVHRLENSK